MRQIKSLPKKEVSATKSILKESSEKLLISDVSDEDDRSLDATV